jgi:AraC family ethanolamine operon transcriptional activator
MTELARVKLAVERIEDLRRVLDGADTTSVPLGSGVAKGTILHARAGDVRLSAGDWCADIRTRGSIDSNLISLGMKFDADSRHFSFRSRQEVLPGDVYALTRGDSVDYRVTGRIQYAFVSLSPELLLAQGGEDAHRQDAPFWERCRWFRAPPPIRALIARSVERIVAQILQPDCAASGPALLQLQAELVEPFLWGFMFDERAPRERHSLSGAVIVRRVEDWVDGQSPETVQIADLCRALRVSRRTLQRAFTETLGMGPARYLTLKRLAAVRAALRQADPVATTVTDTAIQHGFWELGRFAKEYRQTFGESPSETLIRGMS